MITANWDSVGIMGLVDKVRQHIRTEIMLCGPIALGIIQDSFTTRTGLVYWN